MKIDIWYQNESVSFADCFFYPNSGEYRGNLYNKDGKAIGDYVSKNSVEIEKRFPGMFGE